MLRLHPGSSELNTFALSMAVKQSGLTNTQIAEQLEVRFGVKVKDSAISHSIWRGTIRLQRALQILSICGVTEIEFSDT